jgi:cellulose synthase operon protein C
MLAWSEQEVAMLPQILLGLLLTVAAGSDGLDDARRLWKNGRYAEAEEAYDAILKKGEALSPAARTRAVLGRADAQASQGEVEDAVDGLQLLLDAEAGNADIAAKLAELKLSRGDWEGAAAAAAEARKADPDHVAARWVDARLLEARGELDKAVEAWKWFVDRYNDRHAEFAKDAETLLIVGQASERYYRAMARGDELSESLNDVINVIYEGALRADPHCWQAP